MTKKIEHIFFMGFCPNAELANREDDYWKKAQICEYTYPEHLDQLELFKSIQVGDILVLKKNSIRNSEMTLHGHGRVRARISDTMLNVEWSSQEDAITEPAIGAVSTVNKISIENVHAKLSCDFWAWLLVK